jgi:hypothetical protein
MTTDNQPGTEKSTDAKGEVRPSAGKNRKLENKIADEKDEEQAKERTTD